ncbi:hypothetical protein [Pseudonocardia abyssalis]|jgi:hypothetical protein|uniref:ADP-ribosylglycohydrolase n=1 Tax=Pseudonocardia abyssalis TaxID=2792008 RepID=A0ABS6US20_9PSEU|nr:hypothetical protein [Pseudonocardia abyssalis]MBW0115823.1 hypothetical protein [Pseudonocardia abyssalis]MBW0135063.1 hypothetical protein [Pseudonocardia abyssalis]
MGFIDEGQARAALEIGRPSADADMCCRVRGMLIGLVAGDAAGRGTDTLAWFQTPTCDEDGSPDRSADIAQALAVARHLGRRDPPSTGSSLAATMARTWWITQDHDGYSEIDRRRLRALMNNSDAQEPHRSTGPRAGISLAVTALPLAARTAAEAQPILEECARTLGATAAEAVIARAFTAVARTVARHPIPSARTLPTMAAMRDHLRQGIAPVLSSTSGPAGAADAVGLHAAIDAFLTHPEDASAALVELGETIGWAPSVRATRITAASMLGALLGAWTGQCGVPVSWRARIGRPLHVHRAAGALACGRGPACAVPDRE